MLPRSDLVLMALCLLPPQVDCRSGKKVAKTIGTAVVKSAVDEIGHYVAGLWTSRHKESRATLANGGNARELESVIVYGQSIGTVKNHLNARLEL